MTETLPDLDSTASRARAVIAGTISLADLEQFRVEFLGKKGAITAHLKALDYMRHGMHSADAMRGRFMGMRAS